VVYKNLITLYYSVADQKERKKERKKEKKDFKIVNERI